MGQGRIFRIEGGCRAVFEILIKEVQDCKTLGEVNSLLDCWVEANDLHPENVDTLSKEEAEKLFRLANDNS